ncbi:hypothetical protein [Konateibacter massiliensis]|nr:hypothetical protein [Konateibacter massiliensis]
MAVSISKQVKDKINKITYDKPTFNARVSQMKKSFDEVNKIINTKGGK